MPADETPEDELRRLAFQAATARLLRYVRRRASGPPRPDALPEGAAASDAVWDPADPATAAELDFFVIPASRKDGFLPHPGSLTARRTGNAPLPPDEQLTIKPGLADDWRLFVEVARERPDTHAAVKAAVRLGRLLDEGIAAADAEQRIFPAVDRSDRLRAIATTHVYAFHPLGVAFDPVAETPRNRPTRTNPAWEQLTTKPGLEQEWIATVHANRSHWLAYELIKLITRCGTRLDAGQCLADAIEELSHTTMWDHQAETLLRQAIAYFHPRGSEPTAPRPSAHRSRAPRTGPPSDAAPDDGAAS